MSDPDKPADQFVAKFQSLKALLVPYLGRSCYVETHGRIDVSMDGDTGATSKRIQDAGLLIQMEEELENVQHDIAQLLERVKIVQTNFESGINVNEELSAQLRNLTSRRLRLQAMISESTCKLRTHMLQKIGASGFNFGDSQGKPDDNSAHCRTTGSTSGLLQMVEECHESSVLLERTGCIRLERVWSRIILDSIANHSLEDDIFQGERLEFLDLLDKFLTLAARMEQSIQSRRGASSSTSSCSAPLEFCLQECWTEWGRVRARHYSALI